ncbi:cystathionine gamma-synthase [Mobilicoccus pelagius]|uniref:homocysteine desulfhydrase n=1 Tax=Mobilicoccus pelagius NBRC 104925 TaxID=1089455 RepID=H5UVI8_9MICO|nr:cystathionine gamma-synthase [Mobilicoccus pelagius]GAB49746.1 cystathionine gamma-synthase [Mobilicoccus pelagius NBRC 104925]
MSDISRLTRGLRAGIGTDSSRGAVVPPMYLSSTFAFPELGQTPEYDYTRCGNPTRDVLAEAITTLEGGAGATITASGMAAVTNALYALLPRGGTVLVPHDCYGGTWRLFDSLHARGDLLMVTVDLTDGAALREALAQSPALVWVETPSNPLLRITDLAAVTEAAHAAGAKVVADNTFCSPLVQRPFEFGVDAVVHSTTKYVNGHSDVVGGAVVSGTAELAEEVAWWANVLGLPASPYDSAQTLRGLRTLAVRLEAHQRNAAAVAELFASHPAVARTYYPGLPEHPGHEIAARQQQGFGGMVSADLAGGVEAVRAFVTGLEIFTLAESLGGVESLVAHPATMTHASMTPDAREVASIGEGLLRFSVGIDAVDDVLADLTAALDRAARLG